MILTDGVHLISDESETELHVFAQKIGLRREWYQNHPAHPHYDITTTRKLARAYAAGAVRVTGRAILERHWRRAPKSPTLSKPDDRDARGETDSK